MESHALHTDLHWPSDFAGSGKSILVSISSGKSVTDFFAFFIVEMDFARVNFSAASDHLYIYILQIMYKLKSIMCKLSLN